MAETVADGELPSVLKPFYQRASEAEDRLSRLEAALSNKTGHTNAESEKSSSTVKDLESKIKILEAELVNERKKAGEELQKLKTENTKNQYRIGHLVRALKEADLQRGSK